VEEASVPVESSDASDSSESESAEPVKKVAEPELAPPVEAASSAVQEEEKPLPQQVPQLDVSDLMPGAQPSLEVTQPEVTKPEETSDKPTASPSNEEEVDEVDPPGELASAGGNDAATTDREDASDQITLQVPQNDPIEALAADPIVKPEEAVAKEPDPEEPELKEPKPEDPDELESLAQMLQTAVAESSDEDIVSTGAESTDDAELEPEVLAGIEAFRSQLAQMKDLPSSVAADESVEELETTPSI